MRTKSTIQLIKEGLQIVNQYRESLTELMDKYLIEDSIFIYKDNNIFEVTNGYFEYIKECDTLDEAIHYCINQINSGIRIVNNKQFIVGKLFKTISECNKENKILDIEYLKDVK